MNSFTSNEEKAIKFLLKNLPSLAEKNASSQHTVLNLFTEVCFEKGNLILEESQKNQKHSYLIVSGEVLLQIQHNPITQIDYKKKIGIDAENVEDIHNTSSGMGNLSITVNKVQAMCLGPGQWVGEEVAFEDMPIIYDAVVKSTSATLWRINNSALTNVLG